jgi:hypothetical protein
MQSIYPHKTRRRPRRKCYGPCKNCGNPVWKEPRSKDHPPKFCKPACSSQFNGAARRWAPSPEALVKILALYTDGHGGEFIAGEIGEPNTEKFRQWFKAYRKREKIPAAPRNYHPRPRKKTTVWKKFTLLRLQADAFSAEQRVFQVGDVTTHWRNHPESVKWVKNPNAPGLILASRLKFRRDKSAKSNYHISKLLRSRIYRVLKGQLKSAPTLKLLGCSLDEFRCHIQSQFKRGMRWNNHGKVWHLDHKEPCASFDLSKPEEQRRCFHYTNLQPLFAKENHKKHAKVVPTQRHFVF